MGRERTNSVLDAVYVAPVEVGEFIGEECGIVGVFSQKGKATIAAKYALGHLQHRGQEAAGESVWKSNGCILTHVDLGLIPFALTPDVLHDLGPSTHAIAHCRYTTSDKGNRANAQPIAVEFGGHAVSLAHNGNLFDTGWYDEIDVPINTQGTSDSNKLAAYLLWHRLTSSSWREAVVRALTRVQESGSISAVILTDDGSIFGIKDPFGIRPLCIAESDDGVVISSESVAPDMTGAHFRRELKPGEINRIDRFGNGEIFFYGTPRLPRPCTLERLYFSRPDSWGEHMRMRTGRENAGEYVAERMIEQGLHPTVVVPVYDSGVPASQGLARGLSVPSVDAITTSHYIGRTFIMPGKEKRQHAVNGKHHVTPEGIQGEDVVAGDDTLVRANTAPPLMAAMGEAGATKKRLALTGPPSVRPCDLGVDTPTRKELAASPFEGRPLEEIEKHIASFIGADSVTYLPIEKVAQAFRTTPERTCWHCFGGPHPIRGEQTLFRYKERPIKGLPRVVIFISGKGSNMENILEGAEQGSVQAVVTGVISNKADVYGVTRAKNHHIPVTIVSSERMLKDPDTRAAYMRTLIDHTSEFRPDVIVFAGWMIVMDNQFLTWMRDSEIIGINLHPALLTEGNEKTMNTTRGNIPVIRGAHAIEEAYKRTLPVSGITTHQLLPDMPFDTGPVVLQEEVRLRRGESLEEWERRMHEAEHRVLPAALKRVLHVLGHNIDVSKGDFPW